MIFDNHTLEEIIQSIEAESAKAMAEIRCAEQDLKQASNRLKFIIATTHYLKQKV
jgi:exonuclease VII small subunit